MAQVSLQLRRTFGFSNGPTCHINKSYPQNLLLDKTCELSSGMRTKSLLYNLSEMVPIRQDHLVKELSD